MWGCEHEKQAVIEYELHENNREILLNVYHAYCFQLQVELMLKLN